jgi:hypothetical protein
MTVTPEIREASGQPGEQMGPARARLSNLDLNFSSPDLRVSELPADFGSFSRPPF